MNKIKMCDSHIHIEERMPIDDTVYAFENMMRDNDYDRIAVLAIPSFYGYGQNYEAFYCKDRLSPKVYASAGLCHRTDADDSYYLDEIKAYYAMGCDGVKILDGKPNCYRQIGRRLDDKVYDRFYAFCEEKQLPVTMHIGDPAPFWDFENATEYQKKMGWVYSAEDAPLEQLRSEALGILEKFPKLRVIFAHFFFMAEELARVAELFEKYENLCLDLTPGTEMYVGFTENYDEARAFFEKYSDRIFYGTDSTNAYSRDNARSRVTIDIVKSFMEGTKEYVDEIVDTKPLKPFGFGEDILRKIYRENFIRLYGERPRKPDYELIAKSIPGFMSKFTPDTIEERNLRKIEKYFAEKNNMSGYGRR